MDYWVGDILLSLYQQGYMVLECRKGEHLEMNPVIADYSEGFRHKY